MEHGGDVYTEGILKGKEILDFSSNINPLGVPVSFRDHINEALEAVKKYPDVEYRSLKKYIREYLEFSRNYFKDEPCKTNKFSICESDIVLGNGAAEIIDLSISCFKKVCIVVPSFIEYEKNALKWGCNVIYSTMKKDMTYDYEDILFKIQKSDLLIIGNPNNPNGGIINKDEFKTILDFCEENNKTIIIDEAFIEFTGKNNFSFLEEIESYKCIFIIRALTKFFAMPGIRIGYGISKNEKLISEIKSKQNPWNINCFAETAAKYVLKDKDYIENSLIWIDEERKYMISNLKKIGFIEEVYSTYSNFVLCRLKNLDCQKLYKTCLEKGIAIRKCDNFRTLNEKYIRLAIKSREDNNRVIKLLNSLV
ncbi:aminotransferase class I/II-fold pyridoxal phosphate-dependent enzyme [Clostridium sp. P21]|uniref:Aminotransferase class I/II-fold pyridoxal phosphate-dependent enzyme n=1 Tax=Clostridium muellerianum TaxID=2716538 RepID=A0A7Y0EJI7_9CLOT|nr:histidinol-phosphate transaminase [Clostridium muellerianum]NMM64648.1 aminotransferase class I/II-fold pyridoxal phosphate-dependent enzyme [Clostridium muellerianum]